MNPSEGTDILLVDDDPTMQRLLARWIELQGYSVRIVSNGAEAQQAIKQSVPDLVITDWDMPVLDGLELCHWIRSAAFDKYVYTVILTTRDRTTDTVAGLTAGADDFLKKPVEQHELMARIRSGLRLSHLHERLRNLARVDALTGLLNQRSFFDAAYPLWQQSCATNTPVSCVMLDIDYFKRINDTHGHPAGDDVIRRVASLLEKHSRGTDIICRYGGEEFCAILSSTNEKQGKIWANRVREALRAEPIDVGEKTLHISASFGIAERLSDVESIERLIDLADQSLLVAKRSGRDRAVAYNDMRRMSTIETTMGGPRAVFGGLTAKDVMTTVVAGLNQDDSVATATRYFLQFRVNSAPVVDHHGKLCGILTEKDLMQIMLHQGWQQLPIKDIMKDNVVCYEEDDAVVAIYEFLCRVTMKGVVIVRDGKPTGLISRTSLLRWVSNGQVLHSVGISREMTRQDTRAEFAEAVSPERRLELTVAAITDNAHEIEKWIGASQDAQMAAVVGGATRIQDLVNDLLSVSQYLNDHRQDDSVTTAGSAR